MWEIDSIRWLTDVFTRIQACSVKQLEELLPHKWTPQA
ncbi:MAG: transposase domain-containing protein [Alistipes sp.]|nr:transposase domain-containing protein [Alistipes sp.]